MSHFDLFDTGSTADGWSDKPAPTQSVASVASVAERPPPNPEQVRKPVFERLEAPILSPAEKVRSAIRELSYIQRPAGSSFRRWATLLADLQDFADSGLQKALGKGWSLHDLFSVPRSPDARRVDCVGLVPLLNGRPVQVIDANHAEIANRIGPPNTFYRLAPGCSHPFDRNGGALIWDVYLKEIMP